MISVREAAFQDEMEKLCFARLQQPFQSGFLQGIKPSTALTGAATIGLLGYLTPKLRRLSPPAEQQQADGLPLDAMSSVPSVLGKPPRRLVR